MIAPVADPDDLPEGAEQLTVPMLPEPDPADVDDAIDPEDTHAEGVDAADGG